jgi:hypothetical protein
MRNAALKHSTLNKHGPLKKVVRSFAQNFNTYFTVWSLLLHCNVAQLFRGAAFLESIFKICHL